MEVRILYENRQVIVAVKPPGMPAQSDRSSTMDMVSYLKNNHGMKYVGVVHRLDRPVGGIMVYAKTRDAAANLSAQIQKNQMTKKYLVVLTGSLPDEEGLLENYLRKDGRTNMSFVVSENTAGAKAATLRYKVLETRRDERDTLTLAEIELLTGRHHQIRVQTAAAGAGVYGDTKYNPLFQNKKGWFNMGLFACGLEFKDPDSGRKLMFSYEPEDAPFNFFEEIQRTRKHAQTF